MQYAQSIPVNVIARMLGFPPEDEEVFRGFVHNVIEQVDLPAEERIANFQQLDAYIDRQIADHVANPRDDLTSYLMQVELDGHRLAYEHVRGSIVLLLIAGIDTTWSAIGSSLWHLATQPRRPRAAGRRPERDDVRASRSSCGRTPRSRWRGSSRTTTTSTGAR